MFAKPVELIREDDAVSPVIGVILMVAITVILAAVIAAFVLGIGDSDEVAPQTSFSADQDGNDLTVEIVSGDSLEADEIEARNMVPDHFTGDDESSEPIHVISDLEEEDEWGVGESIEIELDDPGEDGSFNIVWVGDGEDVLWTVEYEEYDSNP